MTADREPARNLRRLLTAQVPSDLADWLDFTAVGALLAYVWQVDTPVFALLAVAMGLPYVVIGPLAGAWTDRAGLKRVMVLSNLGKAGVTASFALAPSWHVLLALIFVRNAVDAFFTPAKQATIQALTDDGTRTRINGLSMAINQGAKIVAPAAGGAALAVLRPSDVFLANALVSLTAALLLLRLAPVPRPPVETVTPLRQALREGWQEIAGRPRLRAGLGLMAAGFFAMFFYDTLIAPLTRSLGFSESHLGYLLAAIGAGGVAGALALAGTGERRPFALAALGSLTAGTLVIAAGLAEVQAVRTPLAVCLAVGFLIGLASALSLVPLRSLIQSETRPERMARVAALNEAANTAAMLIAPFLGAAIAKASALGWAFVAGGTLSVLIAFWAVRLHAGDRR